MQNRQGGMGPDETRNLIIAMALAMAVFFAWDFFVAGPQRQERVRAAEVAQQAEARREAERPADAPPPAATRDEALARTASERLNIATDALDGSILLEGARFDDLNLRQYRRTVDPDSPEVTLLSPEGAPGGHDAFFGWEERDTRFNGVGASDVWRAEAGARLTADAPVTLTFATGDGLEVTRRISVDEHFMFTVTDTVRNASEAPRDVRPFGTVRRDGLPTDYKVNQIVHQGMTGVFGPQQTLHETRFEAARKHARERARGRRGEDARILELSGTGGWLGLTDHYWLTALAPDQSEEISAYYDSRQEDGSDVTDFRAAYRGEWRTIQPGQEIVYTQRLFAGAKNVDVLRSYQSSLNLPDFDKAVDWGNFFILTRPYFDWLLHPLGKLVGSFGLGILLTTIVIKLLLFPIVFQSNLAMTKLRKIQPKMKEIQDRFAADKQRQQQEMIRLYQTEKINPVAGCVPILLQIPVFYALYKVLTVTIEMRHAPFYGWIRDLSAPDPLSIFNLFGLLPYNPHLVPVLNLIPQIGPWAIMYGATMWALQALNPPPTDPTQAMIFRYMPLLFVFLFASFPAGLVIYWTWSNILSIVQQYVIMRTQGVDTELDRWIAKRFGGKEAESAAK